MSVRSLCRFAAAVVAWYSLWAVPRAAAAPLDPPAASPAPRISGLEFRGRAILAKGLPFSGTVVGGLSGLAYDAGSRTFWAMCDDRGDHPERGPVRLYRLRPDFSDGRLDDGDLVPVEVLPITGPLDRPYSPKAIDPEGIALVGGGFLLSSEGIAPQGVPPFIARFGPDGRFREELALPEELRPVAGGETHGVRLNLALESLALSPDARYLFTATENALVQDGPAADVGQQSPSRILRFDRTAGDRVAEFVYLVDAVAGKPASADAYRVRGLVDLLPLDGEHLLALEREFVVGVGNAVRLYEISLAGATDVSGLASLAGASFVPVDKRLLVDFADLGVHVENFEGIAFGPELPDGRGSLLVVSDDNFNPAQETTSFLLFAVDREPATIPRVQGAAHRSPFEGWWLAGVDGVVTAVDGAGRDPGFFFESTTPDDDPATSEGVFVSWPAAARLAPGQAVSVNGRVEEIAQGKGLPVTRLRAGAVAPASGSTLLPPPLRLGETRRIPSRIDGDGLTRFAPADDAIDFWESLEGMRVELAGGDVVGPSSSFGELVLRPDGAAATRRTPVGGVRLGEDGPDLQRVLLVRRFVSELPAVDVGDRITGGASPIVGVVDYSFSNYNLLPLAPVVAELRGRSCGEVSTLRSDSRHLTVATFNVENLSAAGDPQRFVRIGDAIARRMGSPALVALEEIQDDSGPTKGDGVVTSSATLGKVVDGVVAAGGPRYQAIWIDPALDREGGQPGGNIRVALLVDPARAELVRRGPEGGMPGPLASSEVVGRGRKLALSLSPGRVAPTSPAFDLREGEGVRRSLVVELRALGRPLFVVVNHWSSKYDDDRPFGAVQPPRTPTSSKREAQAREIRAFVERLLGADPAARVVVLGDLNDFEHAPAVRALAAPPLENLLLRVPEADRYSFNFEGASQLLDHVVVSPELRRGAEVDLVHLDADCADAKRVSDHDPVVVRLRLR